MAMEEDRRAEKGFLRSGSKESVGVGKSLADPLPRRISFVRVALAAAAASCHNLPQPPPSAARAPCRFPREDKRSHHTDAREGWLTHTECGIQGSTILDAILSKFFG